MKKSNKVNLGSGADYREDYLNVDIAGDYRVDVEADLTKPFPFQTDSLTEVLASDILEHMTKEDGERFLRECHRVLSSKGKLVLRTHNVYSIIEKYKESPEVMLHFLYGNTEVTGEFGAHKFAYTQRSLERILRKIGFSILELKEEDTNFLVIARKSLSAKDKPLHIGVIQQTPDMGGAEEYMLSLIEAWQSQGNRISFASNLARMSDRVKHTEPIRIPFILDIIGNLKGLIKSILLSPWALIFYSQLLYRFKKRGVDVIIMSGFSEKLLVTMLSPLFDIPVVWIEYGQLGPVFKKNLYLPKILYRALNDIPKSVITPTQFTKQSLMQDARVDVTSIKVIPCGVSFPQMQPKPIRKKGIVIGSLSRLTPEKGQAYLIKAMPQIRKKLPDATLIVVGQGPQEAELQELITSLGLEGVVSLTGYVQDIQEVYAQMDIFVFPTVWELEGFGLVTPEAMARYIPVIASDLGPLPEIITHDKTGILIPPGSSEAIAEAVVALAKDPAKRISLAREAHTYAQANYNITTVSRRILDVLQEATC